MVSAEEVQPPEFPRHLPQPETPSRAAAASDTWRQAIVVLLVAVTLAVVLAWLVIVGMWVWEVVEQIGSPST
jgi:hypothetical protein